MMKVNYDPVKDFVPISTINANTFALIVNPRMPVKTVAEFVDYARVQPKELVYAEGGVGSIGHLSMALFLNRAGMVRAYLRAVVQLRAEGGNHRNDGD
jgi:tripartite-type tricarboxylate transporter receptor subunit TctC